jgi:probable F420-dependent oxidoreductase
MGYSVLMCADEVGTSPAIGADDSSVERNFFAPLTSLMMAAETTSTLRVCTYVLANDYRHPAVLAKEAATLDVLSDGRLELGLGAGGGDFGVDYSRLGIALDSGGVRVSRLAESVQVIKGSFGDVPFDFSGTYYTIRALDGSPKPLQRPHPPLLLAGGRKRMLSLAGREADIVGLLPPSGGEASGLSLATTSQQIAWVREAAEDRFSALEFNTLIFNGVVTDHPREAAERIAQIWGITPEVVLESIYFLVGTVDGIVDEIQMWRERFGISYICVGPEFMDEFAPVVARLAGT